MRSEFAETSHPAPTPFIAEGRILDAVTEHDVRGTLDDIAEALGLSHDDVRAAVHVLTAVGWLTVEVLSDTLVLRLSEDALAAS